VTAYPKNDQARIEDRALTVEADAAGNGGVKMPGTCARLNAEIISVALKQVPEPVSSCRVADEYQPNFAGV